MKRCRKGVVYYSRDARVQGMLLLSFLERVDAARALFADLGPFEPKDLKGKILG